MALDHYAAQTEQAGSIVLPVIDAAPKAIQHRKRDQRNHPRQQVAGELLSHKSGQHLRQPLRGFQRDVANEAVAHHHVGRAAIDVIALHVAAKVQPARAQQLARPLDHLVALDHFLAHVQQPDGGPLGTLQRGHQSAPEDRELQQLFGRAVHVGAQVQYRGGPRLLIRQQVRDRRPVDTLDRLQNEARNRHQCPGIAGAHARIGLTVLDQLQRDPHR